MDKRERQSRLKQEANIQSVFAALGLEMKPAGNVIFVHCPHPDHQDTHPSAFFKPGDSQCYCAACKQSTNAINLIMWTTGCDFGAAADLLWEIEGRPDWYKEDLISNGTGLKQIKPPFKLDMGDAKKIHLIFPGSMEIPVNFGNVPELFDKKEGYICVKSGKNYVACRPQYTHYSDFLSDREYKELVQRLQRRQLKKLSAASKFIKYQKEQEAPSININLDSLQKSAKLLYDEVLKIMKNGDAKRKTA